MRLFARKEPAVDPKVAALTESLGQHVDTIEFLNERFAELELALDDEGWQRLGLEGQREFTRAGLTRIAAMSRLMYLKNPLIQRAVNVKTYYVWAQGVNVVGRDATVNEILQRFLDDHGNRDELTGHQARMLKDVDLQVEGNQFLVLFPNKVTGHVRVRSIVPDEIVDIWTNPQDARERWFYVRHWTERTVNSVGRYETKQLKALYPDWRYRPANRPASYGGLAILWESPVYHVRVGGLGGMRFGVPETYSSLDWARAYKDFLEDWATLVRSLSRFAWRLTTKGANKRQKASAAKRRLNTNLDLDSAETNPPPTAGATATMTDDFDLAPIPKTGATTSAEDGKQIRLMVASAMDVPDTILSGDVDQGNLATAKTLDRPTELGFLSRQTFWGDVLRDISGYVIRSHVLATRGLLQGTVTVDADGIETITVRDGGDEVDLTVDITFPPILEHDLVETITAITTAATLDGKTNAHTLNDETLVRLLLSALGVDNVDELVTEIVAEMEADADEQAARAEQMQRQLAPGTDDDTGEQREAFTEAMRDLRAVLAELTESREPRG